MIMLIGAQGNEQHSVSLDMLIFAAHPDDAEIGMGGTIKRHTVAGLRVGICDLTLAELSSNGDVQTRQEEAQAAADILGLAMRTNLRFPDRGLDGHEEQIARIVKVIRTYKPRVVLAPYWEDRHPDHVACSLMVQEAVFNAKLIKYRPETVPFTVERLLFYGINDVITPDLIIDVSDVHHDKMAALHAYHTQFAPPDQVRDGVSTPINEQFLERIIARDYLMGQQMNVAYAEGFISKEPYALDLLVAAQRGQQVGRQGGRQGGQDEG